MNNTNRRSKLLAISLSCGAFLASPPAAAEDIDIFIGTSGGTAAAPKIMILMDNSLNWVADQPNGKSKFMALSAVVDSITTPMNVGLAMFASGTPSGAYVRFAPRDMSVAANRTAFKNLLAVISTDANVNIETPMVKDESAALYELFKYFSGLKPRTGTLSQNPYADAAGNVPAGYPGSTAAAQGLTSGFAFKVDGTYDSVATACGRNYIIYIVANNAGGGATGQRIYETVDSGAQILPAPGAPDTYADEWARYIYASQNPQVITYVLDAYFPDDNQDLGYSISLQGTAKMGGGTYTHVRNQTEITNQLLRIFAEIKAVNGTFASASLPVNATNRAQNQNQVFIGMFRPDPDAKPRWFGNMKQYQLVVNSSGSIDLADVNGIAAVNPLTGFITDCATSFWTTDSSTYWQNVAPINPSPAGSCATTSFNKFSDSPDGSFVEKGAVAEVVRKGNNPPSTNTTPTFAVNRTIYTLSNPTPPAAPALTAFNAASSGLPQAVVDFTVGQDVNDENNNKVLTETRPSLHGDVIHSRPLPLNYGGTTGVVVYYGANDGTLRAVDASAGKELWAFVAREHFSKLQRLKDQSPLVNYPNLPAGVTPAPTSKDYFFDGSIGAFQDAKNTQVWIYPSMRRGGRMIYAFDVTNPPSPSFKWKVGCPNLTDDLGCTSAGITGIGQTWSMPVAAFIKGYSTTVPIVVAGGGYDACEDQNLVAPTCTTPKGAGVYILNGNDGTVLASFGATRSVVAEVALLDIDGDNSIDYAFAVDTGGNIYRIDFIDGPTTKVPLDSSKWVMRRVAYTNGSGRKFLFPPALLFNSGKVYVALGSGDREHPLITHYPYVSNVVNRFYVYVDGLATSPVATNLDDPKVMLDNSLDTTCSSALVTPTSTMKGWFMDLKQNGAGEQTVTSAVIAGGLVTFSTNRPIPASAAQCSTTLGEARGYFLNLLNGSGAIGVTGSCGGIRSGIFVGGGLPPSPVLGTIPVGGTPKTVVIGAIQRSGTSSSPIAPQQMVPPISSRRSRTYWYTPGVDN
jgi:type IV pilus assembly protein PilY1